MLFGLINAGAQTAPFARHVERDFIGGFFVAITRSIGNRVCRAAWRTPTRVSQLKLIGNTPQGALECNSWAGGKTRRAVHFRRWNSERDVWIGHSAGPGTVRVIGKIPLPFHSFRRRIHWQLAERVD